MSIDCFLAGIDDSELNKLFADKQSFFEFVNELASLSLKDVPLTEFPKAISLGRDWHGIHFLLTQSEGEGTPPLDFLMHGGQSLNEPKFGLPPVRLFNHREVQEINAALRYTSNERLTAMFNADAMKAADVYSLESYLRGTQDGLVGFFLFYVDSIRQFVDQLDRQRQSLLVSIG